MNAKDAIETTPEIVIELRRLRLWHWRKAMEVRKLLERQRATLSAEVIKGRTATIYTHIGFVQTLNVFFDIGDTAERDAAS